MAKKISLLFFIVMVFGSILYFKNGENQMETEKSQSKNKNSEVISINKTRIDKLNKLNEFITEDKNIEVLENVISILDDQLKCIKDKSCIQSKESRFFDEKLDPAYTVIRKAMEIINRLTLLDPEVHQKLQDEQMVAVVELEQPSSLFLTLNILMRKGKESFYKTWETAFGLKGVNAQTYLKFLRTQALVNDNDISKVERLTQNYLSKDNETIPLIVDELSHHKKLASRYEKLLGTACEHMSQEEKNYKVELEKLNLYGKKLVANYRC
ncbi:MAG: hypothetical protein CME62_04500 [Halobacteriovoraceae bacterium]|nr:hypothetical protein [Halobacteriovoraceae bacterium]|tara:strand:- start:22320 stop:23123 length:804 start_codon:yes stop_codon:yes gene_type:complete